MSVAARLDRLPLGRFHLKLMTLTGVAWLFNSFNTSMVSFVLAVIITQWQLTNAEAGFVGSVQMIGMLLGAPAIGTLSDRLGRKVTLELTLLTFGLATGLAALVDSYTLFTALSFIAGIGLGGMLPVGMTFISELSPSSRRGTMLVVLDTFWSLGYFFAAGVSYLLIPTLGWQAAFMVGALPVLHSVVLRLAMPESPRFLVGRGRHVEAEEMVQRIEKGYSVALAPTLDDGTTLSSVVSAARFSELWSRPFRGRTITVWASNFCVGFANFGVLTWLPALLVAAGYQLSEALQFMLVMSLAQLPGKIVSALLIEYVGRKWTLAASCLLYAVAAFFLGRASDASGIILWGSLLTFVNAVVWGPILAYSAESYPTRARSTGAGAAMSVGRIGGMLGPLFVGFLLAPVQGDYGVIFAVFSVVLLFAALIVAALGEETKGRSLEEIAA